METYYGIGGGKYFMQNVDRTLKFEIDKGDKAVLILKSESGKDTTCLIDTGANVPIWFMGESFLQLRYPSAQKRKVVCPKLGR